ncbi:MAG: chemotaxis protein CheX [Spirochaetales bacterium]|nr:chemotaxis protein CheX [Spirochaetales bacterium]
MNINITGIFNDSVQTVFKDMGLGEIKIVDGSFNRENQVVITIGIAGALRGNLIFRTNLSTAFSIVHAMLKKMNMSAQNKEFDKLHKGSMCEIANMIAARSVNAFSERGVECNITPPTIITGESVTTSMLTIQKCFQMGFEGSFGRIFIFLGLESMK